MAKFHITTAMGDAYIVEARDALDAEIAGNMEIAAQGDDDSVGSVELAPGECASSLWHAPWISPRRRHDMTCWPTS